MGLLKLSSVAAALVVLATGGPAQAERSVKSFVKGEILCTAYDGVTDDLLTAGLGKDGLASSPAPGFVDAEQPTAAELRRLAIYNNYRALADTTPGGGYGTLFGPNVLADGTATAGQGLIAGFECLAFAGSASGRENVTVMVQVPESFDAEDPCIVAAPSSGSRGVYGAIGTAGEWGLKNGCAVAYTDKGTGTGAHDLQDNTVNLITGERAGAKQVKKASTFTARINDRKRGRFNARTPDRFAFKHAHSRRNPEKHWGRDVLRSIEFAFHVLKTEFKPAKIKPDNTIVIASSVSNGGGASVRAAEQDERGLIDGVAVSEPNVNPAPGGAFAIRQGSGAPFTGHSRSLYDYTTLVNVYQGCANLAPENATAPFNFAPSAERCASLRAKGLLATDTLAEQATEAQAIINDFGVLPEQNAVQPSHWFVYVPQAVAVTYANAYGKARVTDNLCGYSFGAVDAAGIPAPLSDAAEAALFATSGGIPPTGGIGLINNKADAGPLEDRVSSPDQNLGGALCLRGLAAGADPVTGSKVKGRMRGFVGRIAANIAQVRASGDLKGTPAIFVTGRADAILPLNHTSRAYYGLNQLVEGPGGNLRYYEVTNAHHLDAFNAFPGFKERYLPLHHYFVQAMDILFDHLRNGSVLPPSQVIHTTPRGTDGGGVPDIDEAVNLPPIDDLPPVDDMITFDGTTLFIPE